MRRALLFLLSCALAGSLAAAGITGTVHDVSGGTASVSIDSGAPAIGDKAEFFFKLAGVDDEISVATGTVTGSDGASVLVKIEDATGEVAKDHLVRFVAGKGGAPAVARTPTAQVPQTTPPPSASPLPTASASATGGYIGVNLIAAADGASGALVVDAPAEGPAATAGLQPNDLIVALDGSPVANPGELAAAVAQLLPGTSHAFLFSRAGKTQKADVLVQTRPFALAETLQSSSSSLPSPSEALPPSVPFPTIAAKPPVAESLTKGAPPEIDPAATRYVNEGVAQYSAGNIDGAIASYNAAIRSAPSLAIAYLNRANAYLYKPNFQGAIADANKALELKVAKADEAYSIRGTAKAGLGNYDDAIADCNRALKINPQHALSYNNRANNKLRKLDHAGALADCNKAIALNADFALPYYNRGFARTNLGDQAGALSDWRKAVRLQSSFGVELNPKIAQLEALGVQAKQSAAAKAPAGPSSGSGDWVDLTNAPQKIVGTWQGGRHRTQYFADGTFVTDPHLVPDPPRGQWQIQGDRLVEFSPQANITTTHNILSLDGKALVIRNPQGQTFRKTRIGH